MTMTTMQHPKHVELPVCPPWCAGHDGHGYQGWKDLDDGQQERSHAAQFSDS